MPKPKITIKDIARESGFSLSTVSLVLNNHPRISHATRNKVLSVVRKYDFHPNSAARGLASKSSRIIGVVIPHVQRLFADVYIEEILSGIYECAVAAGYKMLLDSATTPFIRSNEALRMLQCSQVDGLLFIASDIHSDYLNVFENSHYAFLVVNHLFPGRHLDYVCVDYEQSARIAAEHLLGLGHRQIALIAGTNTFTGLRFRDEFLRLCRDGLGKNGRVLWVDGGVEWGSQGGYNAVAKILKRMPNVTAIMSANDRMALGAMRWLEEHHRRIPEDISVMGADDIVTSQWVTPGLTTIQHDLHTLGKKACQRLFQRIKGEISECRDLLPVSLVKRASTASPGK